MRVDLWLSTIIGLATASILKPRSSRESFVDAARSFRPDTRNSQFFSLRVDDDSWEGEVPHKRPLAGYAIRLEDGIVIATPYSKWWDPKLPIFFVDESTQCYTVGRKPLQLYISTVSGALRYAPVEWLPPNSVALDFSKMRDSSLGLVDSSPAYFAWPSAEWHTSSDSAGTWCLCPITDTDQFQVFISAFKFGNRERGGIMKDHCVKVSLTAVNADP